MNGNRILTTVIASLIVVCMAAAGGVALRAQSNTECCKRNKESIAELKRVVVEVAGLKEIVKAQGARESANSERNDREHEKLDKKLDKILEAVAP